MTRRACDNRHAQWAPSLAIATAADLGSPRHGSSVQELQGKHLMYVSVERKEAESILGPGGCPASADWLCHAPIRQSSVRRSLGDHKMRKPGSWYRTLKEN